MAGDNISKIKDRLNVVDVVSGYLKLQKAGINFKAPCPFHSEKTPSFFISPERQIWHCFGCQKGGDIFTFVKEIEGVEFPEALKILAARAGVELEEFNAAIKDSKDRLYQACETTAKFFEKQLGSSNMGKLALEYLKGRGLEEKTITQFRLGFAPDTWEALSGYLRNSGFTEKEIVDAGLAVKREVTNSKFQAPNSIYDRFRSRIMFPISDVNGRVVGFTGRIFEGVVPTRKSVGTPTSGFDQAQSGPDKDQSVVAKYINTPQTLIYDKSRILYGLNLARGEIRKKNKCLLVEGNMDAIMSYQAGVNNVVASSGTALTPMHLGLLKRFTSNLDLCFDTDSAGAVATKRGIGMALSQDFNVKVVSINDKECKDPADYVQKYGNNPLIPLGASWAEVAEKAKPVVEFYFDKAKENYNSGSAESKKSVILTVAPFIKRLSSRVEKSHWISQLAFLLRVKEDAVESDIMSSPDDLAVYDNSVQLVSDTAKAKPSVAAKIEAPDILNEALLSAIIKKPALFKEEISALCGKGSEQGQASADSRLLSPLASQVIVELAKENLEEFNFGSFTKRFDSDRLLDLEFIYLRSQVLWGDAKDGDLKEEFSNIFNKLKQKTINSRMVDLGYEIRAAEAVGDRAKIGELAATFNKLTRELAEIHNPQISKS
ncbi:MAG: hypothetical protein A2651_00055 [Candidatus Yanofskybacteria bacterium RIFCSPHIGHO2_01_FULL_42_12]|uniref:DNA primase n=1 Tax=Candidatus Yanofskybacteria bacterium RIFCSPLOWO2_01_FULL_42_49 TaxID=1802694 RepID=A0A1F8GC96_9BACT|nr:MAG: hypothetical protein A2651_00055 [Candidatus Yanofskybacteria bacterium RIFCSPHIGHO2_01_FULL_42_12]OGN23002.1 MAG: hypothetical protein A2918_02625 [Candidatus Yanofskybacteria bacterium RIFCSPLOWO2_01_FULL_42_49]